MDVNPTVKLISIEQQVFEVPREVANVSVFLRQFLADSNADSIPLENIEGDILAKVLEYCEHHKNDPAPERRLDEDEVGERRNEDISPWDAEFVKVDQSTLFKLITAANFLDIKGLLDLVCITIANMMKGKSPEEIRATFGIVNDFTPEEEEMLRKDSDWSSDP
eukprot:GCRY01000788.1.p1 GENE.GCRY01000788.1~~GCRY01000788.1.p1  ORF type:complete len:164 (-),score=37.62 GCRY01000788.1:60-551(-)